MSLPSFDIVIVGGGLVGAGLALALQDSSLRIALVDARLPSANDPRLFALNYSSCQFLNNLGLWSDIAAQACAIHQVHVSAKGRFGAVRLNRDDAQLEFLGQVVPAFILESALNSALLQLNTIHFFRPAEVTELVQQDECAILTLKQQDGYLKLAGKVIIGADGTFSTIREAAGIKTITTDYQQSAIVTRTRLQRSHHHIAYERFNEHGAIAMLPLTNNECATIWSAENKYIQELTQLSEDDFLKQLQTQMGYRLGRFLSITPRHHFPLKMVCAEKNWAGSVLLIGNAAHTLHPIAAQGFNLAVYEIAVLAEYIQRHHTELSADKLANALTIAATQQSASTNVSHYLSDLFLDRSAATSIALHAGMAGLDNFLPLKRRFIERMTGRTGRVPRLLLDPIP